MKTEDLKAICDLTYRLTELRLKDCPHLLVENFAPELFYDLLSRWTLRETGQLQVRIDGAFTRIKT